MRERLPIDAVAPVLAAFARKALFAAASHVVQATRLRAPGRSRDASQPPGAARDPGSWPYVESRPTPGRGCYFPVHMPGSRRWSNRVVSLRVPSLRQGGFCRCLHLPSTERIGLDAAYRARSLMLSSGLLASRAEPVGLRVSDDAGPTVHARIQ